MRRRRAKPPSSTTSLALSLSLTFYSLLLLPRLTASQAVETSIVVETVSVSMPAASTITQTATASASTPSASLSDTYTTPQLFKSTLLNTTNFYRYLHSSPFLSYNDSLSRFAQSYSAQCIWAHNPSLSSYNYGENLARGYANLTAAIDAWYNEVWEFDYDFDRTDPTGFTEQTGHFTQLVWKATRSVGCGWTDCAGQNGVEGVLLVCDYWPAGNVLLQGGGGGGGGGGSDGAKALFVQNVLPERSAGSQGWADVQADAQAGVRNATADDGGDDGGDGDGNATGNAAPAAVVLNGAATAVCMLLLLVGFAVT